MGGQWTVGTGQLSSWAEILGSRELRAFGGILLCSVWQLCFVTSLLEALFVKIVLS